MDDGDIDHIELDHGKKDDSEPEIGLQEAAGGLLETARKVLQLGPICDNCLGRQFAMLSTGLSNLERGRSVKTVLAMAADLTRGPEGRTVQEDLAPAFRPARLRLGQKGDDDQDVRCWVCLGQMDPANLDELARMSASALEDLEYDSFLVGTIMSGLLAENEELLLAEGGSMHAEPFKSELNREVGKRVSLLTGKPVDFKNPDVTVHLNLYEKKVELQVSSLYIYGRYLKLERGFPQTRWPCRECKGKGCERCHQTGKMYQESVDELIRGPVMEATGATDTVFHGAGREDIDARMLGTGRPFVVEAVHPLRRMIDLAALQEEIKQSASPKVEVLDLSITTRPKVEELKEGAFPKTYSAVIELDEPATEEKLKLALDQLVGSVEQRTPTRVSHRRADKVRHRVVHSAELNEVGEKSARITVRCEGGLYVKELVSGDDGRTKPSLAETLGSGAKVVELDVTDVGGVINGQVTRNSQKVERQAE
ncbi:MAG: tRNA pseudouridine(54/55) synthase Pus10 [Methanosarcinales archaeon]|nr:tRNA pseudouridine(54/55) synthase Pus10 [Methanosarcinales archaeon]